MADGIMVIPSAAPRESLYDEKPRRSLQVAIALTFQVQDTRHGNCDGLAEHFGQSFLLPVDGQLQTDLV
jgi:hypothetical protein